MIKIQSWLMLYSREMTVAPTCAHNFGLFSKLFYSNWLDRVLEIIKRPIMAKVKQMEMHRRAMADPFDLEAQRFVEEEIK